MSEDHRAEAVRLLENARRTAKLEKIPDENEPGYDEYQEIEDDVADMRWHLGKVGLKTEDIGTDEHELAELKAQSDRLNAPYRRRLAKSEKSWPPKGDIW